MTAVPMKSPNPGGGLEAAAKAPPPKKAPASSPSPSAAKPSAPAAATVTPLDSEAALHLLLSPDGYYRYLSVAQPPPTGPGFLSGGGGGGGGTTEAGAEVDLDAVRRNYRRLSLRHHPDRPGGDADTFRVLNRAKRVLTNPKLRKEYDLLGLDLDDDDEDHHEEGGGAGGGGGGDGAGGKAGASGGGAGAGTASGTSKEDEAGGGSGGPDSIMSHLASSTLASILQVAVRTVAMGLASTLLCRYLLTLVPAAAFLCYLSYRIRQTGRKVPGSVLPLQVAAPLALVAGLVLMYCGRDAAAGRPWSWTFWSGEALVMTMFLVNSVPVPRGRVLHPLPAVALFALGSLLVSLLLRGRFWRYSALVAFEAVLAFLAVLIFPIMEMILEEIMNEKLRKIGEQVRAHARRMDAYSGGKAGAGAREATKAAAGGASSSSS